MFLKTLFFGELGKSVPKKIGEYVSLVISNEVDTLNDVACRELHSVVVISVPRNSAGM